MAKGSNWTPSRGHLILNILFSWNQVSKTVDLVSFLFLFYLLCATKLWWFLSSCHYLTNIQVSSVLNASENPFEITEEADMMRWLCAFFLPCTYQTNFKRIVWMVMEVSKDSSRGYLERKGVVRLLCKRRQRNKKKSYRYSCVYSFCCTRKVSTLTMHHLLKSQLPTGM